VSTPTQPFGAVAPAFDRYAAWYDAFNEGKDYAGEARYVLERARTWHPSPRKWLDVGCGTGNHAAYLNEQGVDVEGVDASPSMIGQARAAHPRIPFTVGEAHAFRLAGDRDVISMLFHVLSYHVLDFEVSAALDNIRAHLGQGGILVFDFWHTDGVLLDPPGERIREARADGRPIFRLARPVEDRERRIVDIHYQFRWDSTAGPLVHEERHSMRHFTVAELASFLDRAGLEVLANERWMRPGCALQREDWYGVICARRRRIS
jgi:SAM-dependent methyltransferase